MASWKKLLTSGTVTAADVVSGTLATARIPSLDASKITSGTIADARLPGDCGARTTYDNYSSWTLASSPFDSGGSIASSNKVTIAGGTGISSSRSTRTVTLALSSGAALANLGGSSGSTFLRKDGTWATPTDTDTNTTYAAGNGIALSGTTFSVTAGTSLTQNSGGLSVTSGGIGTTQLANSSVTNAKLGSQAVTTNKIADEAVTGNEIESGTIESGHLNQGIINSEQLIDNDVINSQHYVNGSIDAVHLGTDINPVYTLHFSNQITIINGRYYTPNGVYGANYYSWNKYTTSMPTSVSYSGTFYCLPIVVPKAGKIVKWGWHGACNSSTAFPLNWCLKHGTMTNGGTASGTLTTVGSVQNRSSGSSGRYYEWKNTGLSHSVSEDDVLLPVSYGTGSGTKYGRGVFYIVIEYSL